VGRTDYLSKRVPPVPVKGEALSELPITNRGKPASDDFRVTNHIQYDDNSRGPDVQGTLIREQCL
jgi:hypothetical protein